jgi:hypothetical protein
LIKELAMQVPRKRNVPLPLTALALAAVIAATVGSCSRTPTPPAGDSVPAVPAEPAAVADEVDAAIAEIEKAGLLGEVEASLSAALAEAEAAGRPAPGLQLALAAVYGRKGLAEKAYAAVKASACGVFGARVSIDLDET